LGDVRRQLQVDDEWAVVEPGSFTWWAHRLRQKIVAEKSVTRGGLGIVNIWAETDLLVDVPNESRVEEAVAVLNSTAALNTLVWRPTERRLSLRCASYIYSDIRGWMTGMFCSGVAMQIAEAEGRAESLQKLVGGKVHSSAHPTNGFRQQPDDMLNVLGAFRTGKEDVSPFYGDEMLSVIAAFEKQILVTGDQSGVTMEFPFPDGIPPTALVRLLADVPHPTYGSGVMLLMKLPLLPSGRLSGAALANALNLGEIDQIEAGYGFGSWCLDVEDKKGTAYVGFLPAAMYAPSLLNNIVVSLSAKARWAHLFLDLGNNAAEVGQWHKFQSKFLGWLSKSAKA
jgi:hypothetical protein